MGAYSTFYFNEIFILSCFKRGILLNSGSIYAQETGSYLRLSYAYASLPDIDRSIKILAELIRELQV